MQLCKVRRPDGTAAVGVLEAGRVLLLNGSVTLSDVLYANDPMAAARSRLTESDVGTPVESATLLPPLDDQEVWAAGVTYKRSREARERESAGAARFYDLVYKADRPELFFKAPANRVVGSGGAVRVRRDSRWTVPEPEVALVVSPAMKIVGYTIGNDMSSRDIEGENPLYLPQAKIYDGACALGPAVTLAADLPPADKATIRLTISRGGTVVFDGSTTLAAMHRSFADLVAWLGRETTFPNGVVLLTGTGVVPPDDFTLAVGDAVAIDVTGIGRLANVVK
ncbi:MAG TPA: fumarylacetoacetate hydrolase family protein [Gemmataceae bacterium]|nr:fumarylacetoacetate hydrolase family protein [Gemmataceae bacterium]